ncbi:acylneuraminate cytidylyltransferase [Candidatus Villigracilis affinis]|uniref:acylneuraminate cytidylyltransferase n=1 Tax=Candidatus Villigracilis affinis TaxID=3140682 RepID=UPI001DAE39A4|nr:acylneuraminate cytidylyltransferase [Anaerolineales bacterium]
MTNILALIPARGGSKGIPRKNIRNFAGYPLIAWSIAAAKQSELVTRIIVSTDNEEIAAVAREWGAETPFLRPAEFAQDKTTDLPVFEHALKWLEDVEGYRPDIVIQLRPTSPIRPHTMVDDAIRILLEHPDADCVRGVVPAGQNPFKMWRFNGEGKPLNPLLTVDGIAEPYNAPRQILPPVYWQTGHIDAIRESTIANKKSLTGDVIYPLVIDPKYTVDIDTLPDWAKYEALVYSGLEMVSPGAARRPLPETVKMIICDFDGVVTDNLVITDQDGRESVTASRSDSMHIKKLREMGVEVMILSSEPNPVVMARAKKMGVEAIHNVGMQDKGRVMREILAQKNVKAQNVVYLGNDLNDLPCFEIAGWSVAVADAYPEVLRAADHVLTKTGGHGAIRELCEIILKQLSQKENTNGS